MPNSAVTNPIRTLTLVDLESPLSCTKHTASDPKKPDLSDYKSMISLNCSPSRYVSQRLLIERINDSHHLIFHPLTGQLNLVTEDERIQLNQLGRGEDVDLAPAQEQELRDSLYLFNHPSEEEDLLDAAVNRAWDRMRAAQPESYTVCPTLACNLACAYCFEGDSLQKPQGTMSDAQVDSLFRAITQIRQGYAQERSSGTQEGDANERPPWINLFGGEPFLPSTHHCVASILERAEAGGFLVGATTNGVNLTRFQDLLTRYQNNLAIFQITLDGPKAVHDRRRHRLGGQGTFDEIVRGIDLLLSLEIPVNLRVNLDASNLASLPELVLFMHDKGWADDPLVEFSLAPVTVHQEKGCQGQYDTALTELELAQGVLALLEANPQMAQVCHLGFLRHLEHLISILEPEKLGHGKWGAPRQTGPRYWYCEASTDKQFVFTPEGLIYSCTEAVGQPHHAIGRFDPALELWKAEHKQWVGRTILSHPQCRTCSISTLCGGGCNLGAREKARGKQNTSPLIQISPPGQKHLGINPQRSAPSIARTDPFCNAAEETVRAYLRYAGSRMSSINPRRQPCPEAK